MLMTVFMPNGTVRFTRRKSRAKLIHPGSLFATGVQMEISALKEDTNGAPPPLHLVLFGVQTSSSIIDLSLRSSKNHTQVQGSSYSDNHITLVCSIHRKPYQRMTMILDSRWDLNSTQYALGGNTFQDVCSCGNAGVAPRSVFTTLL